MDSRLLSLKLSPLLAAAVLMVALSCPAQRPATNGWQPIIFSSPDHTEISSNLTLRSAQPSSSGIQSKLQLFQDASPVAAFANMPLPAGPAPMPSQMRRSQKSSGDIQQWEFMTPAEILGVAPDQILQTQRRDTNSDQGSLTPMERYLQGQSSFAQFRTNSPNNSFQQRNLWADGDQQTNNTSSSLFGGFGNMQSNVSSPFLGNAPSDNLFRNSSGNSDWSTVFGSPAPQPVSNPAQQQSDMGRFMRLLNPDSTPATASPDEMTSFKAQTALPDSDSTEPLASPLANSFAPLSSGISKPAGLTPLPTLTQQAGAQPVAPPAWAPQPPPWMSSTPQPFAIPQRKF
jgi:hypothetical protein